MKFLCERIKNGEKIEKELEVELARNAKKNLSILTITDGKKRKLYLIEEYTPDPPFDGRAFQLHKMDGSETYSVFIAKLPRLHLCDCRGFANRQYCKHVDSLKKLLEPKNEHANEHSTGK